jgi:hypothetical protein
MGPQCGGSPVQVSVAASVSLPPVLLEPRRHTLLHLLGIPVPWSFSFCERSRRPSLSPPPIVTHLSRRVRSCWGAGQCIEGRGRPLPPWGLSLRFKPDRIVGFRLANRVDLDVFPAKFAVLCSLVIGSRAGSFLSTLPLRGWFLSSLRTLPPCGSLLGPARRTPRECLTPCEVLGCLWLSMPEGRLLQLFQRPGLP